MAGEFGRVMVIAGVVLVALGLLLLFTDRIPGLGRLPGDFAIKRGSFTLYFPLATSILISLVLTAVLNLVSRR